MNNEIKEILEITKEFHDTYEKLASEYTYETREDTKVFDINSNNGKLMYATVNEIVSPILKENKILRENAEHNDKVVDKINWENQLLKKKYENAVADYETTMAEKKEMENQQKEFIKYLEDEIDICDGFLDTVKSDLQEIPYGVISANENITTRIKENETAHKVYEEILQKYKSIIGDDK